MSSFKNIFYFLPFVFYMIGYLIPAYFFHSKSVITPPIIGKNVQQALLDLSEKNLHSLVIKEIEDSTILSGTVIEQIPAAGKKIKERQAVYITISKQPVPPLIPNFATMSLQTITNSLNKNDFSIETHFIASEYPIDQCFAQFPAAGSTLLSKQSVIIYVSSGLQKPFIWPNFEDRTIEEVLLFLEEYDIKPTIIPSNACSDGFIIQQRPLAGTLITRESLASLSVQLLITQ